jgi:hypothetical protein
VRGDHIRFGAAPVVDSTGGTYALSNMTVSKMFPEELAHHAPLALEA